MVASDVLDLRGSTTSGTPFVLLVEFGASAFAFLALLTGVSRSVGPPLLGLFVFRAASGVSRVGERDLVISITSLVLAVYRQSLISLTKRELTYESISLCPSF